MEIIIRQKRKLFYISYFLYVIATVLQSSMFTQYSIFSKGFVLMRYAAFVFGAVKVIIDLLQQWNKDEKPRIDEGIVAFFRVRTIKQICLFAAISVLLLIVSFITNDRSLIFVFVIVLAARGILMDAIVKKTLVLQLVVMAFILISSSLGVIPDLLFKREQIPIRHALGYTYPSVMVTSCFFILLLFLWNKNRPISWKEFLVIESLNFLVYKLTDSKTGFLMIAFVALVIWVAGSSNMHGRRDKEGRTNGIWQKIGAGVYDLLPICLVAILLILCITLPWEGTKIINKLLTNRLQLIVNAVQNYGIHAFGSNIEWVGFGGTTNTDNLLAEYNFVDSSYAYILINYGWIVFALSMFALVWCCRRIRNRESGIRQFIFAMVLVYCFIEPRLLELQVNTFLLLLSPLLNNRLCYRHKNRKF